MQIPPLGFSAITLASLGGWLWALIWAALVFAAIAGYGGLLLRGFGVRRSNLVLAATAGFGPAILLGGLLNLLHLIYASVLIGFVVVGVVLTAFLVRGEDQSSLPKAGFAAKSLVAKLLLVATVLALGYRVAGSVHDCYQQQQDDFNYYLAAPKKMIQTHSFGSDPYSERREISSIGGNEFLDTLILAAQHLEEVQMGDWTLGLYLLALLAFALGKEFELTEAQRYALAFFIAITPQLRFNLTFVVLPGAIFTGLVYVVAKRELTERYPLAQAAIAGGMVGAVSSMKTSNITLGVVFLLCVTLLRWWKRGPSAAIRFAAVSGLFCVLVMLPWMVANHGTAGTWLFPILGKGFHYSAYGHYVSPSNATLSLFLKKVLPFCLPMLAIFFAEFYFGSHDESTLAITALALTAFVGSVMNGMATGGDSVRRYNYPCILPAITLAYVVFAQRRNLASAIRRWRIMEAAAALVAIATAINTGTMTFSSEYRRSWTGLQASLTDYHIATADVHDEYAALQRAIPDDGGVVATLENPYLLDFSKRDVMIADFPGAASPKPGWPTWEDGEAFARFLLGHNVRYLIYSYNECDGPAPFATCDAMLDAEANKSLVNPRVTQLIRNEASIGIQARHQYGELALTRKHIYDDGKIYMLDLTKPAS